MFANLKLLFKISVKKINEIIENTTLDKILLIRMLCCLNFVIFYYKSRLYNIICTMKEISLSIGQNAQ